MTGAATDHFNAEMTLTCDLQCAHVADLLPDDAAYESAYFWLPAWRRSECDAFLFVTDHRRSVAAWLLLRRMMSEWGFDTDSLSVSENAFGKPAFDPPVGLHFSISHAGNRVMVAVSDAEVGCDVERIVPVESGMLRAVLLDAERASLAALSDVARNQAFFRLWVRKESYAKAVGRGLDIDLSAFSALETPQTSGWTWQDFDSGDGYLGCVCTRLKRVAQGI